MTCKSEAAGGFPNPGFWLGGFLDCMDSSEQASGNKTTVEASGEPFCTKGSALWLTARGICEVGFPLHLTSGADGEEHRCLYIWTPH